MGNEAVVGSAVFASVELCTWFPPPMGLPFISYNVTEQEPLPLLTPVQTIQLHVNETVS